MRHILGILNHVRRTSAMNRRLLSMGLGLLVVPFAAGAVAITDLKCEDRRQPVGVDVLDPGLSWVLQSDRRDDRQTAYQVLVAGSPQLPGADQGDLWKNGKGLREHAARWAEKVAPWIEQNLESTAP